MLDAWRDPARGVRIEVRSWKPLKGITDQYIERPLSVRSLIDYVRRVGVGAVWRKVRSRLSERDRNQKVIAYGTGVVMDAPETAYSAGEVVHFVAPNHPISPERVVVDQDLVRRDVQPMELSNSSVEQAVDRLMGWSPFSGQNFDSEAVEVVLAYHVQPLDWAASDRSNADPSFRESSPVERLEKDGVGEGPTAVLFGLGNYSKTLVVPGIRRRLQLACVHEVDPAQLANAKDWGVTLDTSPMPRPNEAYDAWYIAGYHHTHADLAIHALRHGGYAIVEKPLATTEGQLDELVAALRTQPIPKLFACFQRRYSLLNSWCLEDLGASPGEPINYHCIVYEIPLPRFHWYNWPNSRSRLTSNGCHWIDHFLFLNRFPAISHSSVARYRNGDLMVSMEVSNGASFSMLLTDHGSSRLGVRDYVELRGRKVTVSIVDQQRYRSESSQRILRKRRVNPVDAYRRMYRRSVEMILAGGDGDGEESLLSTRATLSLEHQLTKD